MMEIRKRMTGALVLVHPLYLFHIIKKRELPIKIIPLYQLAVVINKFVLF